MLFIASQLAFVFTEAHAGPVHRSVEEKASPVAALTPAASPTPTLVRRQDDGQYSYLESGCVYTTFPEATITQTDASESTIAAAPGCLCAGGTIAGLYTDSNTGGGTQNVYCATGELDDSGTPTGTPATSVTVSLELN